jgi:hypothetical protein
MTRLFEETLQSFNDKIQHVRNSETGVPKSFDINLAIPLTDEAYGLAGNVFYILHAPDDTVYVRIKVNAQGEKAISYHRGMGLETPFHTLYITTPAAQTGTMTIIYATEAPELMRIIDNRSSTSLGVNQIVAELQGDATHENYTGVTVGVAAGVALAANVNRKACWFDALSTNTHSIFLGFTNAVTAGGAPGTWFKELVPGAGWGVDDYRGVVYAIGGAAAQYLGVGEW